MIELMEALECIECLFEILCYCGEIFTPRTRSRRERLERLRKRRRNRAIYRWLSKGDRKGPVPNIGLRCTKCDYRLVGLIARSCPECGRGFDIREFIDPSVGVRPRRRQKPRSQGSS